MDSTHPKNQQKLLTFEQAAKKLAVPQATLKDWQDLGIIKPVEKDGVSGFTQDQLDEFLHKVQSAHQNASGNIKGDETNKPKLAKAPQDGKIHTLLEDDNSSFYEKTIRWLGNGVYGERYIKNYFKSQVHESLGIKLPSRKIMAISA